MFAACADPASLEGLVWMMCYLTSGKHLMFYMSFGTVLLVLAATAPLALGFGYGAAMAARSSAAPLRWFGHGYISMVRGVPDIIFFLFVPIALDQGIEYLLSRAVCDPSVPVRQGSDFIVCAAAKVPAVTAAPWVHNAYAIFLAVIAFAIVFGAFAGNVLYGAMKAVPRAQLETAEAYGMSRAQINRRVLVPQMWTYALPGLSNLWMLLIKATPLLFILGVQDIVYWARELGGSKSHHYDYPHPDWRLYYFTGLLVFYLLMTMLSERVLDRLRARLSRGQATLAGEQMRKALA
ncbi:MAG: ABC transporter permease subunit [Paracoccus sp. (in: a-proteobacteria)]|nr:ABC transporter permease subunit [Paracoccus sp. (in: a-proteobacteria)]